MSTLTDVVVIAAVVVLVLVRQFRTQQIAHDRRWWVLPGVLLFCAVRQDGLLDVHHRTGSVLLIGAELLVGLALGAGWAWTTKVWAETDGTVWAKGTMATAAVWVVGMLVRLGMMGVGALAGVRLGSGALLMALAASLLVRSGVLTWRAGRMRAPYGVAAAGPVRAAWKDRV
ncbi:DUF1453 family protein [Streptomyces beijiangensis]|uniref:DUF1453 family protein n=1 Tax=Streptomyces beijiangensis TaxID=163361 RepID=A0A939FAI3_9ACTN|nr:DUF1453 family protein [Streptomyces beijiangensis]MBO0514614.1 DUF1453 family protein [Streptomyces beijiangensis]